jgi:chemotaxis signal transduction protein
VAGRQVHFLFSVLQVLDVTKELAVTSVPFSPPFLQGIAEWRERILPVMFLEACLGFPIEGTQQADRFIVVRMREEEGDDSGVAYGALGAPSAIRILSLPVRCTPSSNGWIARGQFIRGVYEWAEGLLVVVDMEGIASGAFHA